jgi:hypothetical protein
LQSPVDLRRRIVLRLQFTHRRVNQFAQYRHIGGRCHTSMDAHIKNPIRADTSILKGLVGVQGVFFKIG